jgi:hypothetical protein
MKDKNGWYSGYYQIVNKEKYIGTKPPMYRSSWEARVCKFLDENVNVIRWGFEVITIPYKFDIDGRVHNYITDFYAEIKDKQGKITKYILEIKPQKQTVKPIPPKINNGKAMKRYMYEARQYVMNQNKWQAVTSYCNSSGITFKILTESNIFKGGN